MTRYKKIPSFIFLGVFSLLLGCSTGIQSPENNGSIDNGFEAGLPIHPDTAPSIRYCDDPQPGLITDLNVYSIMDFPLPEVHTAFRDPIFGSCIIRVTNTLTDLIPEDPSGGMKNEYSRVQAFNSDGSYILVRSTDAFWYIYDAHTLNLLAELPIDVEPRWDAVDPNRLFFISETCLMALDLSAGTKELIHDFSDDFPGQDLSIVWTRYEGSPSFDGRYWGLIAQDESWIPEAFLIYDLHSDEVISIRDISGWSKEEKEIDSVTISPLGNYYLAFMDKYCEDELGSDSEPCGLMVYDQDLRNGRSLLPVVGHSDTAVDAQGREVLVFQDIRQDNISVLDLGSGAVLPLWPIDFSQSPIGFHFSGRAIEKPGWVVVSTYSGASPSATWMDDQVFVIELIPGGRIVRLAHTHSLVDEDQEHDYWAEPHASVNQDFTRILFTSNWGQSGSDAVEMYLIHLMENWLDHLP